MRLKTLRVHGFKSFADVTEIHFHEGITAVVGPNGCGKSNISDAVRWVLGEQRPTAIRGAKMEEVIFQGSLQRRPVNRGAVSMVVTNEDAVLPVPFEEVEIGRTIYRDGHSDYTLNRSAVRLKDVVDLVRGTGLGANAYSVIENRMIDAILSDRAEERRALFEEASGIGKYKDRRKSATRRLDRAELDLQRLEDVIAEVQSKVRSLARQKGKAERYLQLRNRRLFVEVAVISRQLESLQLRKTQLDRELHGGEATSKGMVAELRIAEAEVERLRLAKVDAERARSEAAGRLEEIKNELVRWERDLAVADERTAYAGRRLGQIEGDREANRDRAMELEAESERLSVDAGAVESRLRGARTELDESRAVADTVRERLQEARDVLEEVETRERTIARRSAQLDGDAQAADAQAAELGRRLEGLREELQTAVDTVGELESQGDLFGDRLEGLLARVNEARALADAGEEEQGLLKKRLQELRSTELEAADRASALRARIKGLEELERAGAGVAPAVKAVLAAQLPGVLGPLVDFLEAPPELLALIEAHLGPLAQGLIVEDRDVSNSLLRWFASEWKAGGGLVVLPLDSVPADVGPGDLLDGVETRGEGAPWVRALLGGVDLVAPDALFSGGDNRTRLTSSGVSRDALGVVRIGNPAGPSGVLERRERLREIRRAAPVAEKEALIAREAREGAEKEVQRLEEEREHARAACHELEDQYRAARSDAAAQTDHKSRMNRVRDELSRQVEGTRASRIRALERAKAAREDREGLLREEEGLEGGRREARASLESVQEQWDEARTEESRLAVSTTRLEGELERLRERLETALSGKGAAAGRVEELDQEEAGLQGELAEARALREKGAEATATLFGRRDETQGDLRGRDDALQQIASRLSETERGARLARQAERKDADHRHELELERQELEGRIGRIKDRLEGEWGRPLEVLLEEAEGLDQDASDDPEALEEELREIVASLDRIGLVNMLAVEEHQEESERLAFLREQHDDLVEARDDLRSAIKQINETATGLFLESFERIRDNFRNVHARLFEGGEADLWLEDEGDPLESVVQIHASPRGKKTQRIDLLSGGERSLTALALLFAIYLVKPSPFCVLDEVDAPLDENNIGRFIRLLNEFKEQTQFVVITHNPRTIESADWIYGVTMEEPGVSTMVGVRLEDALEQARGAA